MPDSSLPWQEQILATLDEYRSILLTVRDSAEVLLDSPPFTPQRLKVIDNIFRIFLEAGLPPEEVIMVSTTINNFVISFVMDEMKILNIAK